MVEVTQQKKRAETKQVRGNSLFSEQQALRLEQEARQELMEMNFNTRALLEEQRCTIVDQANFELNMREAKYCELGNEVIDQLYKVSRS